MKSETQAIQHIESYHMSRKRRKTYIALENMDFVWDTDEIKEFKHMWREGKDFEEIAGHFGRSEDECAILLIDLAQKKQLKARSFGLWKKGGKQ